MNRAFYILLLSLLFFNSCTKKESENVTINSNKEEKYEIEFLSFIFQPSLKENIEININFKENYLIFRPIYSHFQEASPFGGKEIIKKPIKPFYSKLKESDLDNLKKILFNFKSEDFKRIEGTYIDGTSYNFSILMNNQQLNVGNIAMEKTENQKILIGEILSLISKTNQFEDNNEIISYYNGQK